MAIEKIRLKNFTVFEDIDIDFCEGVNVFIGENGTGKTHLLTVLYFFTLNWKEGWGNFGYVDFEKLFGEPLDTIRNLPKDGTADFSCTINGIEEPLRLSVSKNKEDLLSRFGDKIVDLRGERDSPNDSNSIFTRLGPLGSWQKNENKPDSIFIPAKEMLSHSKSLLALDRERNIPFNDTLIGIVAKAELGEAKTISKIQEILLSTISDIIDGKVIYENDIFYMIKKNGLRIKFSMEADGLCKFGLLWKLIRNRLIEKDTVLLWDEPEANINPQLIPDLVDILLELQRNGVQIILATHDYNLAKYFEVRRKDNDKVLYHCLYKTDEGVKNAIAKNYRDIQNNSIEIAFETLHNDIIDKAMEDVSNE